MKRSKQTSKKTTKAESPKLTEVERVPPTPQDMAEGFNRYAKLITERKYNKAGLPNTYDIYERGIRSWRQLTKKYLGIDTPEPEPLPGNDYYAGMVILAQYCSQQAVKLLEPRGKSKRLMPAPLVVKCFHVTIKTLERRVETGDLIDYREETHAKNASMQLDLDVILLKFEKREPTKK